MDDSRPIPLDAQLAAAIDWWRLAGVDMVFEDEPHGWLRFEAEGAENFGPNRIERKGSGRAPAQERPPERIGGDPGDLPQDLETFHEWWLSEPTLDLGGISPRVAPSGTAGADLMVLVPMPETDDREILLSGPEGHLIANMVAAMGLSPETVYFASALPAHLPDADWPGLAAQGLADVLGHHVALASPTRLLVLGRNILPLLGHDLAQGTAAIKKTAIQAGSDRKEIPTMAGFAPDRLLHNAKQRASLWRRWLDWTDTE